MITHNSLTTYRDTGRALIRGVDFIYLLPHLGLRDWTSNYTVTFPQTGLLSDDYAVIPHGCATLVFSADNARIVGCLFGPSTKPAGVGRQANSFNLLFIVEFQPAGYYAFSGMPQKELTDCLLPFEAVNPALNRLIAEKLEASADVGGLIAEVDRLFLAHLKAAFLQQEFSLAERLIIRSGGLASVKELSKSVYYSERHLGRIFEKYMGVGVKPFSRLVRVNRAIRLMRHRETGLTRVYMDTGFYDMPHFIRDFKAICGVTPQEYRDNMSDYYSEIAKF
jgi:AraC-like DNA-binding protein